MPSNPNLAARRQAQGVQKRNATLGAARRQCPQCLRKAATSSSMGADPNREDPKKYDTVKVTTCRWCEYRHVEVYNGHTGETYIQSTTLKPDFEVGQTVWILVDVSAAREKAHVVQYEGVIEKFMQDKKGCFKYKVVYREGAKYSWRYVNEIHKNKL